MTKQYIALTLVVFIISLVGCATNGSVYPASKDEIVAYEPAHDETVVVFPKNFKAPKKMQSSDKDVEMYLRYADAMKNINSKVKLKRIARKEAWEKYKKEYQEYLERVEAERRSEEYRREYESRVHTRWWRYSHNLRYVPSYWQGFFPVGPSFFYEWWDPCLPNTGHRVYLRAATNRPVLGSSTTPTTRGTTVTNGRVTYPSRSGGKWTALPGGTERPFPTFE
ncbi:MAG: hypothetical protein K8S87_06675 [Planctomycetes bacterium]|nr:hypothetical protein [Planctomycetota bacterium]